MSCLALSICSIDIITSSTFISLEIPTLIESTLGVPNTLCAPVNSGIYSSSSGFCHPVDPSSFKIPITLYEVPAMSISLLSKLPALVFSSLGIFEPTTTTLFLPKLSFSSNNLPDSSSYPLTPK